MKHEQQRQRLKAVIESDPRFKLGAYLFVSEAVGYTMAKCRDEEGIGHISGQELLEGIREHALQQFGPLTLDVLQDWGVSSCEDFGAIVFNMVEHRLLGASENDSAEDFKNGYDFREAFLMPFAQTAKPPVKPERIA